MKSENDTMTINVAFHFSRYPAGRFCSDGPYSGEKFREEILLPALKTGQTITVEMDGTRGYGSSFLEEAFGGLVRKHEYTPTKLMAQLNISTSDESIRIEITDYIEHALPG